MTKVFLATHAFLSSLPLITRQNVAGLLFFSFSLSWADVSSECNTNQENPFHELKNRQGSPKFIGATKFYIKFIALAAFHRKLFGQCNSSILIRTAILMEAEYHLLHIKIFYVRSRSLKLKSPCTKTFQSMLTPTDHLSTDGFINLDPSMIAAGIQNIKHSRFPRIVISVVH